VKFSVVFPSILLLFFIKRIKNKKPCDRWSEQIAGTSSSAAESPRLTTGNG
jgi:hypothetical protein